MSNSISLPVNVLTFICIPPLSRSTCADMRKADCVRSWKTHMPQKSLQKRNLFPKKKKGHTRIPQEIRDRAKAFVRRLPSVGWIPSECCSQQEFFHPPAACPQKSSAAGQEGCPPCPGFCSSPCRWYLKTQPVVKADVQTRQSSCDCAPLAHHCYAWMNMKT